MPTEVKSLFHPDALRPGLSKFVLPPAAVEARPKLEEWAKRLASGYLDKKKETELLPGFVTDVFEAALGYTRPPADPYTLRREALVAGGRQVRRRRARAVRRRGRHVRRGAGGQGAEGPAGPQVRQPASGRPSSRPALYALQLKIDWYLVTNLRETRLYYKRQDTNHYELFETAKLADADAEFRRFVFLLGAERVVGPGGNHLDALLVASRKIGREVTADYYREYRDLRRRTFQAIREQQPGPRAAAIARRHAEDPRPGAVHRLLRGPRAAPGRDHRPGLPARRPVQPPPGLGQLQGAVPGRGRGRRSRWSIPEYNGGLFAPDPFLESLLVPDDVCAGFKKLADYEYGTDAAGEREADRRGDPRAHLRAVHLRPRRDAAGTGRRGQVADRPGRVSASRKGRSTPRTSSPATSSRETLGPVLRERFEGLRARCQDEGDGRPPSRCSTTRRATTSTN